MKYRIAMALLSIGLIGILISSGCGPPKIPEITTGKLAEGIAGNSYSQTLTARGGAAPYIWIISGGTLPPGLNLDPLDGVISGTPLIAWKSSFLTFQVTDRAHKGSFKKFLITIKPN
jgi:hypothetical protein